MRSHWRESRWHKMTVKPASFAIRLKWQILCHSAKQMTHHLCIVIGFHVHCAAWAYALLAKSKKMITQTIQIGRKNIICSSVPHRNREIFDWQCSKLKTTQSFIWSQPKHTTHTPLCWLHRKKNVAKSMHDKFERNAIRIMRRQRQRQRHSTLLS